MAQEYVDTSALIALGDSRDANHGRAVQHFRDELSRGTRFTVGKPVLVEYIDGVTKRVGKDKAMKELAAILSSRLVSVVSETGTDWNRALSHFRNYKEMRIDLTDAISFAIMERLHLNVAFTFDSDFAAHSIHIVP